MSKNFEITAKEDGKKYWISRAMAVCAFVIVYDENDNTWILINKRGEGTPDFQGCWNIPCGYLDWDETTSDACTREVLEECKVWIDPSNWHQFGEIEDSVTANRQNVTIRKIACISTDEYNNARNAALKMSGINGGENNEVDEVALMPLTLMFIETRDWAFNHKDLVTKIMLKINDILDAR